MWVSPGQITALVGRNGQGKSTLFKIAAGLLRPDFGIIKYEEERFTRTRLSRLARRGLYFLPEGSSLSTSFTLGAHLRAIECRFGGDGAARAIEWLRLGELGDRLPHTLSGGERRRADLALAVARAPTCLLADEPFLGIMPKDAELLISVFKRIAQSGCAVAITGHEVHSLFETADDVLWMTAGTTHVLGTPAKARQHDQFCREYLGPEALA